MTDSYRPERYHSVTPRLFADDPEALAEFLRAAFGATGEFNGERPAELRIGDSLGWSRARRCEKRHARRSTCTYWTPTRSIAGP
ncbi:MAG: hypothetical protein ACM3S1_14655 [Hyphomicrobiales bacterium]